MAGLPDLQQLKVYLKSTMQSNPFIFSLLFLFFILLWRQFTKGGKLKLPPNPPKLPIIGNLHQLTNLPHRSLQTLADKYGPLMLIYFGQSPTLVVSSVETAKEVMKANDISFANRPKLTSADVFLYGGTDIGFSPYGDYWRSLKKISVLELLSLKRVKSFQFVREEEVEVLVDKISKSCLGGFSINLSNLLLSVSNNIISRCVLGVRADGDKNFGELSRRIMTQFTSFSFRDSFPSLWWMDHLTGIISRLQATQREVDIFLDQVIEEHKTFENNDEAKTDFVHIILQLAKNNLLDVQLTQDNLKAVLMDMFVGGTDTSATTMEWAMAELLKHQNIMRKAQEEVRRVVGKKPKVETEDIANMSYLKCVIKETLRLHPPAPLLVPRESTSSVRIGEYSIPPKMKLIVNAFAIQRDHKVWDRAEEFIPERFEKNQVDFKGQDFQFIPFGAGRRSCPGIAFGFASVECALANLLFWFDWKLPHGLTMENLDMTEAYGLTVHKKIPLCLVPTLYN